MIIQIEAMDTLFFRDGKPFVRGSDTDASGIFPPLPSVFYGALRTAYFTEYPDELPRAGEPNDPTANLRIKRIFYQIDNIANYPLPLDCVRDKNGREQLARPLLPVARGNLVSAYKPDLILQAPGQAEVESAEGALIAIFDLQHYLKRTLGEFAYATFSEHTTLEPKTGITKNKATGTAKDGMLFQMSMRRLQRGENPLRIFLDFDGLELPGEGLIKLGREGKHAFYSSAEVPELELPEITGDRFKVYVSTPSIFGGGWLPDGINKNTLEGDFRGSRVKVLAAAVGRPLPAGGFDMKRGPKPMRTAVPAGSVYYLECLDGTARELVKKIHGHAVSDFEAAQGFGIAYVGALR